MDLRTHTFLANQLHTAATNGSGDVLVGIAVVFGFSLVLFAIAWLMRNADDSDSDSGWGGGGGGPSGPERPPSGPSWWPDFEREFARYAAACAARRPRSRELIGTVGRDRALVPQEP